MDVLLGQILGTFIGVVGLGMILNPKFFVEAYEDMAQRPGVRLLFGVLPVLVGSTIVAMYPAWVMDWSLSITVLGYWLLVVGSIRYIFIEAWMEWLKPLNHVRCYQTSGACFVLIGGFMLYHALGLGMLLF